jgi:hypothetical protein
MKTDKKIEEIIQDNLLSLVEFDGDNEKGFGTAVDVSIAHRNIMEAIDTEIQKQVEDGIRGFAEWVFDDDTEIFFDSIAIKTLAQEYLSQQKGRSSVKEDK